MKYLLIFLCLVSSALAQPASASHDAITNAYVGRVQAGSGTLISTDSANRISAFLGPVHGAPGGIQGLKEIWIMRSGQNTGTGTIAYGLLGIYDATLVNGPTWGSDGISFVRASDQYLQSPVPITSQPVSTYASWYYTSNVNSRIVSFLDAGNNDTQSLNTGIPLYQVAQTGGGSYRNSAVVTNTTSMLVDAWNFAGSTFNSASSSLNVNGNSVITGSTSASPFASTYIRIGSNGSGDGLTGTISFVMISNSLSGYAEIRSAYKQYLGGGLGLP